MGCKHGRQKYNFAEVNSNLKIFSFKTGAMRQPFCKNCSQDIIVTGKLYQKNLLHCYVPVRGVTLFTAHCVKRLPHTFTLKSKIFDKY